MANKREFSSFRDPSGFVFYENNVVYRQVNINYKENYDFLMDSGLYSALVEKQFLIPHKEINNSEFIKQFDNTYKIIKPEKISFISYPYEWSFSQLKDAALLTLNIQKTAMDFGMILKDASAYNIQFENAKPVFIDTLSFEIYSEGSYWTAYKQFSQHFLAPLLLMSYKDIRFSQLLKIYIDGIPLDLASSLLPFYTWFNFSILSHIHLHSKSQNHFLDKNLKQNHKMTKTALLALIDNLENLIKKLKWKYKQNHWVNYYNEGHYSEEALTYKKELVSEFLDKTESNIIWDIGANTGFFSRIAASKGILTISSDIDPASVEENYIIVSKNKEEKILPLLIDITNPSPGIGWENEERQSLLNRGKVDTILALALIHHLAITNRVPFFKIAKMFSESCKSLIVEFILPEDKNVKRLLAQSNSKLLEYTQADFEKSFKKYFVIKESIKIKDSKRILYLMYKK